MSVKTEKVDSLCIQAFEHLEVKYSNMKNITYSLCLMEEDSDKLMPSVFIVITCVAGKEGKRGQWGLGKGIKSRAVDSEHGVSKGRDS